LCKNKSSFWCDPTHKAKNQGELKNTFEGIIGYRDANSVSEVSLILYDLQIVNKEKLISADHGVQN